MSEGTSQVYKHRVLPGIACFLCGTVGVVLIALLAATLGILMDPSLTLGQKVLFFTPFILLATIVGSIGIILFLRFRFERVEVAGSRYVCYDWLGKASAEFEVSDVLALHYKMRFSGVGRWVVSLPECRVSIRYDLLGIKAGMEALERRFHEQASPLDGVYRWLDPHQNKYGALFACLALTVLVVVFASVPVQGLPMGSARQVGLVFGLLLALIVCLRAAGTMTLERLVVCRGTYSYYSWTGRLIAVFVSLDVLEITWLTLFPDGKPTSWVLTLPNKKIKIGTMLGIEPVVFELDRELNRHDI